MKKSLIALAALATVATAAQAQSSVTIYGVMDMGVASVTGVATNASNVSANSATSRVTGMQNGGLATSRLGFRGTEDLGGGLKANFNLEAEVLGDTGSQQSTAEALFARASWVGLSGGFGDIKLGRQNAIGYAQAAKFDLYGGGNVGGLIASGQFGYLRLENAVTYTTPTFNGAALAFQTGTRTTSQAYPGTATATPYGEVAGKTDGNRNNAVGITYNAGKLETALTFAQQNNQVGDKLSTATSAHARYNFGFAQITASYVQIDADLIVTDASGVAATRAATTTGDVTKTQNYNLAAVVPVTSNFNVHAGIGQINYTRYNSTDRKPQYYSLGGVYNLSKRTALYGIFAQSKQDNGSAQAIVSTSKFSYTDSQGANKGGMVPVADKDQSVYMIGVRHTF